MIDNFARGCVMELLVQWQMQGLWSLSLFILVVMRWYSSLSRKNKINSGQ